MVSIPRLSMGQLGGSPVGSPPADSSPISPKSWEDSLLELDSDLQKICGSPSPATSMLSLYKCGGMPPLNSGTQTYDVTSTPQECPTQGPRLRSSSLRPLRGRESQAMKRPLSLPQEPSPPPSAPTHHYLLRSQSCVVNPGSMRPVPVRHEETSMKLAQKLSRICGPGQLHESLNIRMPTAPETHDVMALHHHVFRRESLKCGFKHQVSVTEVIFNELTVFVTDDRRLVVTSQSQTDRVLDEVPLPPSIRLRHLMCYVLDDELYIRERSKPLWRCESDHAGPHYLPIITQAEHTHDLRVLIRVPDAIRYEDLIVRTVDDCLTISRKRSSLPGLAVSQYEVTLVLPDMGDSRGVEASLSHSNQLYIIVSFDSRRYTC